MGKTIGQGRLDIVRSYAKTMQGIFVVIGVVSAGLLFLFKDLIVGIYAISDETAVLAVHFLVILSAATVGSCYEYPVEAGDYRRRRGYALCGSGGQSVHVAFYDSFRFSQRFCVPVSAGDHILLSESGSDFEMYSERDRLQQISLGADSDEKCRGGGRKNGGAGIQEVSEAGKTGKKIRKLTAEKY